MILQELTQVRIIIHSGLISQHPSLNGHDIAFACQYNNVAPTNFLTHNQPQVPVNNPLRRSKRICGTIITIHNNTPEPSMFNTSTITIIIHYNCTTQQSSPAPRNHQQPAPPPVRRLLLLLLTQERTKTAAEKGSSIIFSVISKFIAQLITMIVSRIHSSTSGNVGTQ